MVVSMPTRIFELVDQLVYFGLDDDLMCDKFLRNPITRGHSEVELEGKSWTDSEFFKDSEFLKAMGLST